MIFSDVLLAPLAKILYDYGCTMGAFDCAGVAQW